MKQTLRRALDDVVADLAGGGLAGTSVGSGVADTSIVVVAAVAGACLVATGSHSGATRPEDLCIIAGRLVVIVLSTLPGAGAGETKDEVGLETGSAL